MLLMCHESFVEQSITLDFYDGFSHFAQYGSTYQRIVSVSKGVDTEGRDEVLAEVRGFGNDLEK